ncbi:hypothetical protein Holit_00320 [Hollandina sp. SP2]
MYGRGGAILLTVALIFSACDNGTTDEESIPSLPAPEILSVVNAQEGVITVTWNPEVNAKEYQVWRRVGDEAVVQLDITSNQNPLFADGTRRFDDVISTTNQLCAIPPKIFEK